MIFIKQLAIFLLFFGVENSKIQPQNFDFRVKKYETGNKIFDHRLLTIDYRLKTIFHAFHTSLTQIDFNQKEKSLEISIRVFTDDFETVLTKINGGQKIIIAANDKNDAIINKYIQQRKT